MGGRDSSSSKKKRDRASLQKRESNKDARIHTSNSNRKSKKLRTDYSASSSSDDQSLSSDTSIDYTRKKKKTKRSRSNLKKRARERSSRLVEDGEAHNSGKKKKRKRSSRDYVDKAIKKSSKRKKPRKCLSSSSSQTNNTLESYEDRKKHKVRYPSVSDDWELLPVNNEDNNNNSRRLRSVIVVVDHHQHDEGENRWDPHKEEIVYNPNDFPSPKSLDGNEVGIEVELEDRYVYESRYDEGALCNAGDPQIEVVDMSSNIEKVKDTDTSVPVVALDCDLESILRQKALENMKKFKGILQMDRMSTKESDADRPSDVMVGKELVEGNTNSQEMNLNSENVEEESRINTCPKGETNDGGSNSVAELSRSSTRLEGENESKVGSEFKEKTMSVMRGGEMVQVSYKVYIPKKSPATARKLLRR